MADEQAPEQTAAVSALPESVQRGLHASVKYLVGNFLNEKHYSKIGASLASRWDRFQSLSAAMKLMEQHGVKLSPEEEKSLSGMNEGQMIEALVMKMPQQSKEQFQHFFLQLQLIVSTATRVRSALEQGDADTVSSAMEDADSTGIAQYILKMSIVQAGSEVVNLKHQHSCWVKDAEAKLCRLVRGQEEAMIAKQRLEKANMELSEFQSEANEKVKKVLMSIAGGASTAGLHAIVTTWHAYVKKMQHENLIYEEYREQIEAAEKRLIDAKADQLKSVKGMIERKAAGADGSLIAEIFGLWKEDLMEKKFAIESAEQIKKLEAKLQSCQDQQSANAKKVMARMGAATAESMRNLCFHEWVGFHKEYLKNKEFEDQLKETEKKLAEYMKSKKEGAESVLNKMSGASDSGLLHNCLSAWQTYVKEVKEENAMAELLEKQGGRFGQFGDRNKKSAMGAMDRAHHHGQVMIYLRIFQAWRMDLSVEKTLKGHQAKIEAKRQQLLGVQQMFRNFALQLESGIKAQGDSTPLGPPPDGYKYKKQMTRGAEGAVSLPDIHAKPGMEGGRPRSRGHSGDRAQPKEAWAGGQ